MRVTLMGLLLALALPLAAVGQTAASPDVASEGVASPDAASPDAASPAAGTDGKSGPPWRHALALSGEPGYPPDFPHFDYVNPAAPKGGLLRLATIGGFDSFNPVLSRGSAPPFIGVLYDTLLTPASDEENISAAYGLLAEAVRYPDDYSWVEFRLDPRAHWHDGTPITAQDVVWSLAAVKEANPNQALYYREVVSAEALDERTVRFTCERPGNAELPYILGQLSVLPKAWWTGTRADGTQRSITAGTLEPPLGSGPYRIDRFEPNRFVEYARVPDYWAREHPTQIGTQNFDAIRFDVYRDTTVVVEAFKADAFDLRFENSAKAWATQYDFPAVRRGDVIKEAFPLANVGRFQGFFMNLRLPKFQDKNVRRALNLMYDFESQRERVFHNLYERIDSYFWGTELAASGLPQGRELALLEEVRDLVPPEVFTEASVNPETGAANVRRNAREAIELFRKAGYEIRDGRMVNMATGEPFTIEVVDNSPTSDRFILPYARSLELIGVELKLRIVDSSQYQNLLRERHFEMAALAQPQSLSPGNEQAHYWGSEAADAPQSENYAGIKDPAVDALINRIVTAADRDELVAATRALDRVLLHNYYTIPLFGSTDVRTVRWNRFSHPADLPPYGPLFPQVWWWDAAKAARIGEPS